VTFEAAHEEVLSELRSTGILTSMDVDDKAKIERALASLGRLALKAPLDDGIDIEAEAAHAYAIVDNVAIKYRVITLRATENYLTRLATRLAGAVVEAVL
jgi:hypothetical protein